MSKSLWEVWLPQAIAKAKEDVSKGDIWKYARYFRMFMERFRYKFKDKDLSYEIEKTLFFRGKCALKYSSVYETVVVIEIDDKSIEKDPNGYPLYISGTDSTGNKYKHLKVDKDCVIMYSDSTHIAPLLYIWAMANDILELNDILRQQNNMLRKPIMVAGEGAGFDEAMNKVQNVLSGIQWFNYNSRKNKKGNNIMSDEKPVEVLNLQVGNSYKGIEIWDNIKHKEEYICDYLGYTTTKNEKRERMNSLEIENENSIGLTFYKAQVKERTDTLSKANKLGLFEISFEKLLTTEEGGDNNDNKEKLDRNSSGE